MVPAGDILQRSSETELERTTLILFVFVRCATGVRSMCYQTQAMINGKQYTKSHSYKQRLLFLLWFE